MKKPFPVATIKSRAVAAFLGVPYWRLHYLIRAGKITPARDGSGEYAWSEADIERARELLRGKTRKRGNGNG